jgi:hypothetical protein
MKLEEIQQKKLTAIAKKIEKRLKSEGFGGQDYTIRTEVGQQSITVTVDINFFLPDNREGTREFDTILRDVKDHCSHVGELRVRAGDETYFAGPVAGSIIKRGKTIKADALLSTVQVVLTFASNFK